MHLRVDLPFDLPMVDLGIEDADHFQILFFQHIQFQDLLFHFDGLQDICGDIIETALHILDILERGERFGRDIPVRMGYSEKSDEA